LVVISGDQGTVLPGSYHHVIQRVAWSLATFTEVLARADVALAPLTDDPYSRGKCAYKLLQYAAVGLPMVGSPIGANEVALRRFTGLSAGSTADWVDALLQLFTESAAQRAARGLAAQRAVRAHYSFNAWKSQWCDATGVTENNLPTCAVRRN
jgi:glycosyltransferase involved in cell wall biosynthesis